MKEFDVRKFGRFVGKIVSPRRLNHINRNIAAKNRKINSPEIFLAGVIVKTRIRDLGIPVL